MGNRADVTFVSWGTMAEAERPNEHPTPEIEMLCETKPDVVYTIHASRECENGDWYVYRVESGRKRWDGDEAAQKFQELFGPGASFKDEDMEAIVEALHQGGELFWKDALKRTDRRRQVEILPSEENKANGD